MTETSTTTSNTAKADNVADALAEIIIPMSSGATVYTGSFTFAYDEDQDPFGASFEIDTLVDGESAGRFRVTVEAVTE